MCGALKYLRILSKGSVFMPVLFWFFVVLLLLCALVLLLIWPGRPSKAQLAPFARRCFAHRGLHTPD